MRSKYDQQLQQLNNELTIMGGKCEFAIAAAVKALLEHDTELAEKVARSEAETDEEEKEIQRLCLNLFMLQQPVAGDLRRISAALKMITDLERIADQAADIAEIVPYTVLMEEQSRSDLSQLARAAVKMVTDSVQSFVDSDIELAKAVISYDDVADGLFLQIKRDIIKLISEDPESGQSAVDILMIAKYLERIADHAVNIGEWVIFVKTGD